jgi:hypothetical protein
MGRQDRQLRGVRVRDNIPRVGAVVRDRVPGDRRRCLANGGAPQGVAPLEGWWRLQWLTFAGLICIAGMFNLVGWAAVTGVMVASLMVPSEEA